MSAKDVDGDVEMRARVGQLQHQLNRISSELELSEDESESASDDSNTNNSSSSSSSSSSSCALLFVCASRSFLLALQL